MFDQNCLIITILHKLRNLCYGVRIFRFVPHSSQAYYDHRNVYYVAISGRSTGDCSLENQSCRTVDVQPFTNDAQLYEVTRKLYV